MQISKKIDVREIEKKNYHLFVNIFINKLPCRLLIDTGASKTVFDIERALHFITHGQITHQAAHSVGLSNIRIDTKLVTLKKWEIGKLNVSRHEVALLPLAHINEMYREIGIPEVDGVLGSDFLMKFNAIIHYKKWIIKLSKK
jgi:hypothetical protein